MIKLVATDIDGTLLQSGEKEFSAAVAGEKWLDFMLSDKGTGMRDLCSVLGISLEDVIAIGDNYNDLPMLAEVGHPWIMKIRHSIRRALGKAMNFYGRKV